MKNRPGPFAPPALSLPSLKMTALSYSWTTLTHMKRERGRVARNRRNETAVRKREQIPGPSGSAAIEVFMFGSISGLGGNRTYGVKWSVLLVLLVLVQFRVYRIVFPATVRVNVSSTFLVCYLKMNFTLKTLLRKLSNNEVCINIFFFTNISNFCFFISRSEIITAIIS